MNGGLTGIGHEANEGRIPLVDDLRERSGTRRHQNHSHTIAESLQMLLRDAKEGLGRSFLGVDVLKVPDTILSRQERRTQKESEKRGKTTPREEESECR